MVSIVICSVNVKLFNNLSDNIANTIGLEFETIKIDNKANQFSLTKALNSGAEKAKYDNLLFIHEDVFIHTINWGEKLVNLLNADEIGIVGISGAVYKSAYPSTWSMVPVEYYRTHSMQQWKDGSVTENISKSKPDAKMDEVVVLDGVFLAMRKKTWTEFQFNEWEIRGFHFYDYDICLRVSSKYKLIVTYDILLEHFSEGTLNQNWILESIRFHKRFKQRLPTSCLEMKKKERDEIDGFALIGFIVLLIKNRCGLKYILTYFLSSLSYAGFRKEKINLIKFYILSKLNRVHSI